MLDAFAAVLVENDKTASLEDELVAEFKKLESPEEITKVASEIVSVKTAYGDSGDLPWLQQYEGSPLYQQAVALEEQALNTEAARIKSRMEKKEDNWYAQEDMIRLKKKLLDLDLAKSKMSGKGQERESEKKPAPAGEEKEENKAPPAQVEPEPLMERTAALFFRQQPMSDRERAEKSLGVAGSIGGGMLGMGGGALAGHLINRATGYPMDVLPAGLAAAGTLGGAEVGHLVGKALGRKLTPEEQMAKGQETLPTLEEQKAASIQAIDLAGRSLAHAFYKMAGFFSNKPLVMPGAEEREAAVGKAGKELPLQPIIGGLGGGVAGAGLGSIAGHYAGGALGKRLGVDLSDPGRNLGAALGSLGGAGLGYSIGEHMAGGQEAVQGPADRAMLALNAVDEGKIPGGPPSSDDPRVNKGLSDQLAKSEIVGRAFGVGAGGLGGAILGGHLAGGNKVRMLAGGALGGLAGMGLGGAAGGSVGRTVGALGSGGTMERNYNQAYAEDAARREAARAAGATLEGSEKAASIAKYAAAVRVGSRPFVNSLQKEAFLGALASKALPMLGEGAMQVGSSIVGDKAAKTLGGAEKFLNPLKTIPAVTGTALQGMGKIMPGVAGSVTSRIGKFITPS